MNTNNKTASRHYSYRAVDQTGRIVNGSAAAPSIKGLYLYLQEQQLALIRCRPVSSKPLLSLLKRPKISQQDLIDFCLHMQYMDQAGVPVLDALKDAQSAMPNLASTIDNLIHQIKRGSMLSEALAYHENIFPALFRHIIELAEHSGNLSDGFKKLYDHLSWSDQNKKQLVKSIRYPAIVFSLICFAIWLMTSFVVPQMQELINVSGTNIPVSSLWLFKISGAIGNWSPTIITLVLLLTIIMICLRQLSATQRLIQDRYILKIPYIGTFWQKRDISLYIHFLYICFSAGIDLLDCLKYSIHSVSNSWLKQRLTHMHTKIRDGEMLSQAFKEAKIFDQSTIRMLQIGEVTGQLKPLLATLEIYQMRELKTQLDRFLAYLQPALLGIIGLLLIWIILGVFYPMYDNLLILEDIS